VLHKIHHQVRTLHRYQAALGTCCRRYHHRAERTRSLAFRRWLLDFWRGHADHARGRWHASPVRANLMCIHSGEGPWDDPGAPYWGGLQMDRSFQATYGPEFYRHGRVTADHWTPLQQLTAGARAVRVRGYTPWPNTGAACGLL
jgi:hypothetical protein